jgi:type III pantothenate kinase
MNLIIDQGNTVCKLALFEKGEEPVAFLTASALTKAIVDEVMTKYQPEAGILSSVKNPDSSLLDYLKAALQPFIELNSQTPLPIQNAYATPETLGLDRLAAAVGAWSLQPGKPLLIIDMGTAITYDFVTETGRYIGGNIAPGLQTRLRALNHYTDRLPLVEPDARFLPMGNNTETAIRSGVMQGIVYEVEGYIRDLQQGHPQLFTFLTGGDLIYFDGKLKSGIFVCKNLVLTGLNRILRNNVHP